MRLCGDTADRLSVAVERPQYDRAEQSGGIVHFGIGAFHRAHQAWYTDRAMSAGDRDWMITGVSLRGTSVAKQMNPQDGLYTVTERSGAGSAVRLVAAVRQALTAQHGGGDIVQALSAPQTRIVGLTVTEKGYCRAPDGSLDLDIADSGSFYPLLSDAFRARRAAGIGGLTLLSCDNLAQNGDQLAWLMSEYLDAREPALAGWFERECRCPSTMVDRIVPAATDADRNQLAEDIGLTDKAAVFTEPFSQWIIEDNFAAARPGWEKVGAQLVSDVAPFETAKLRMLNGAHSALAYLGLERGHIYVHEAVADPAIRLLVEQLMRDEAAPTIAAAPGQDLHRYAADLLHRFENPALAHRLAQIAMDGSQKLPQRWLATLAQSRIDGRDCPAILAGIGAWLRHVRGDNGAVDDPLAADLKSQWDKSGESGIVQAVFGSDGPLASDWRPTQSNWEAILQAL